MRVDQSFRPSGWLGLLTGARYYHDIVASAELRPQLAPLVDALGRLVLVEAGSVAPATAAAPSAAPVPTKRTLRAAMDPLDCAGVVQWAVQARAGPELQAALVNARMTGRALAELWELYAREPGLEAVGFLCAQLNVPLGDALDLVAALRTTAEQS